MSTDIGFILDALQSSSTVEVEVQVRIVSLWSVTAFEI